MHTAITLVCNPARPALDAELGARVSAFLDHHDWAGDVRRTVLAKGVAEDLEFHSNGDLAGIRADVAELLKGRPIDIVVQPAEGRRKRLLVADMDSTIIGQECIDELAEFVGLRAEISAITEQAMRGEIDFEEALLSRVALLKGLPESVLEETYRGKISLNPGARTLVQTMKKFGARCALVSGGFTFFTERVAAAAGFDVNEANELTIRDGVLSGDVRRPIRGREAKENALLRIAGELGLSLSQTLAVGDGANDLDMIGAAGLGVAYHAKPKVAAAADASIRYGDLTALLYLQGVPRTEFVG